MRRSGLPGRPRPAIVLAALLAVLLQAFAVQTHIHSFSPLGVGAAAAQQGEAAQPADAAHVTVSHERNGCVLCAVLAASGRTTLQAATAIVAAQGAALTVVLPQTRAPPLISAHSWQSRAPPIAL